MNALKSLLVSRKVWIALLGLASIIGVQLGAVDQAKADEITQAVLALGATVIAGIAIEDHGKNMAGGDQEPSPAPSLPAAGALPTAGGGMTTADFVNAGVHFVDQHGLPITLPPGTYRINAHTPTQPPTPPPTITAGSLTIKAPTENSK